jgi:hypothetical protein
MTLDELLVDMNACATARDVFRGMTPDAAYRYIARYIPHDGYGDAGRFGDTPDDWIFWFAGTVFWRLYGAEPQYRSILAELLSSWEERETLALMYLDWMTG